MKITFSVNSINSTSEYSADLNSANSLAIPLLPDCQQPNHFAAPACQSHTLEADGFIGDTRSGGSCNVNVLTIIPHCNGTHTESVAHIIDEDFAVFTAIKSPLFPAVLITLAPHRGSLVTDAYTCPIDPSNKVITKAQLTEALANYNDSQLQGLVIRTLPNNEDKKSAIYNEDNYPVFLSNDAMNYIVERGVEHLLVDFPSVDKMYDQGKLSNHRLFWNVNAGENYLNENSMPYKTISEMIYVAENISDGFYLCDLQVPAINSDAVPSRPLLYSLEKLTDA